MDIATAVAPVSPIQARLPLLKLGSLYDQREAFDSPGLQWVDQPKGIIARNLLLATLQKFYGIQDSVAAFWRVHGNPVVYRKSDDTKTGLLDLMIEEGYATYLQSRFGFPIHIEGEENKHYGPDIPRIRCLVDPIDGTEASDRREPNWTTCVCFLEPEPPFYAHYDDTELAALIFQPMTGAGAYMLRERVYSFSRQAVLFDNQTETLRPLIPAYSPWEVPRKLSIEYKIPNRSGAFARNSVFDCDLRERMATSGAELRNTLGSFNYKVATVSLGGTDAVVYIGNETFTDLDAFASGLAIADAARAVIQARQTGDAIVLTVSANHGVDDLVWENLKQAGLDVNSSEQLLPIPHRQ